MHKMLILYSLFIVSFISASESLITEQDNIQLLCRACEYGDLSAVKSLIAQKVAVNVFSDRSPYKDYTPLFLAVHHGHKDIVHELLQAHANPNIREPVFEQTVLHKLCSLPTDEKLAIAKILVAYDADPNLRDKYRSTPLRNAAYYSHEDMVKLLLPTATNATVLNALSEARTYYEMQKDGCPQAAAPYIPVIKLLEQHVLDHLVTKPEIFSTQ